MEYAHTLYEFIIVFSDNVCQSPTCRIRCIVDKIPFLAVGKISTIYQHLPHVTETDLYVGTGVL